MNVSNPAPIKKKSTTWSLFWSSWYAKLHKLEDFFNAKILNNMLFQHSFHIFIKKKSEYFIFTVSTRVK